MLISRSVASVRSWNISSLSTTAETFLRKQHFIAVATQPTNSINDCHCHAEGVEEIKTPGGSTISVDGAKWTLKRLVACRGGGTTLPQKGDKRSRTGRVQCPRYWLCEFENWDHNPASVGDAKAGDGCNWYWVPEADIDGEDLQRAAFKRWFSHWYTGREAAGQMQRLEQFCRRGEWSLRPTRRSS